MQPDVAQYLHDLHVKYTTVLPSSDQTLRKDGSTAMI